MKLSAVLLLLIIIFTGCSQNSHNELSKKTVAESFSDDDNANYVVTIKVPPIYKGYERYNGKAINLVEVLKNEDGIFYSDEKAEKITGTLTEASLSWINEDLLADPWERTVLLYCTGPQYICVLNEYYNQDIPHSDKAIYDFITVDMQTGERVFLNDLVDVDKLVEYLYADYEYASSFQDFSVYNIKKQLYECSLTHEEYAENRDFSLDEYVGNLIPRCTFYIQQGKLGLWFSGMDYAFEVDISEISDLLKVEPW